MFRRIVRPSIPAYATSYLLPVGTHQLADIAIQSDGFGDPLKFKHDMNNPRLITFPAATIIRKVIITITQEFPFSSVPLQPMTPRQFTFNNKYVAGELVMAYGGMYICDKDYVIGASGSAFSIRDLKPMSYPVGSIQYTPLDTLGEGWHRCDGTVINAPYSLLHGYSAPDLRNRYPTGGNYDNNIAAGGVMGRYLGANSGVIDVRHLPNNSFNVNISQDPQKIAYLNTSLLTPTDTNGDPDGATDTNGNYPRAYWRGREWNNNAYSLIPAHGHSGSVQLNSQSQLAMDNRPASTVLNAFIRL